MSGQELDLNRGGAARRGAADAEADYVPGTRSNFPANDSLAGLAYMAGVPRLARDMTAAMTAKPGFEEMITHQVAAGHAFSMNVMCQCNNQFLAAQPAADDLDRYIEVNKATAGTGLAGIRMMHTVQTGMALFDRLRNGGVVHQRFTVERVPAPAGRTGAARPAEARTNGAAHREAAANGAAAGDRP